jgi:MFS family permease
MQEFKQILAIRNFRYLWASQVLSQVTVNIMNFLLLTRLFTITGSSIATSFMWIAYALPAIFVGPIGSASVDWVDRRKMLMWTNFLQALTVFSCIFLHQQSIFLLYLVVLLYSLLNQFYGPAESASLPSLVSKDDLAHANSIFFMTMQVSLIVGFGFAGLLQAFLGFDGSLVLCSIFLFLAFVSTSFLPKMKSVKDMGKSFEEVAGEFFGSIIEGYKFIKQKKEVLTPLLLILGIQVSLYIGVVSVPSLAVDVLGISVNFAGISLVVPAAIGALLGSVYIPKLIKKGFRKKAIIENSLGVIGSALLTVVLVIPHISFPGRLIAIFVVIAVMGFGFVGVYLPSLTFLQQETPSWLRGRVFGSLWFLITIATIFPVLFSGAISEIFGARMLFGILGLGAIAALIYSKKKGQEFIETNFTKKNE